MSIFCRHSWDMFDAILIWHTCDSCRPFHAISYQYKIICTKCGKYKGVNSKKFHIKDTFDSNIKNLSFNTQKGLKIFERICDDKIIKKYKIKNVYNRKSVLGGFLKK